MNIEGKHYPPTPEEIYIVSQIHLDETMVESLAWIGYFPEEIIWMKERMNEIAAAAPNEAVAAVKAVSAPNKRSF